MWAAPWTCSAWSLDIQRQPRDTPSEKLSAELSQPTEGRKMNKLVCLFVSNLQNADVDSYSILPIIN